MTIAFTKYTDDMDSNFGGYAKGPFVFIRPKYKNDAGLHNHEYEHVNQFWFSTFISSLLIALALYLTGYMSVYYPLIGLGLSVHSLLYKFVPQYKLWAEVESYAVQLRTYGSNVVPEWVISVLLNKYNLKYTSEEILKKFEGKL